MQFSRLSCAKQRRILQSGDDLEVCLLSSDKHFHFVICFDINCFSLLTNFNLFLLHRLKFLSVAKNEVTAIPHLLLAENRYMIVEGSISKTQRRSKQKRSDCKSNLHYIKLHRALQNCCKTERQNCLQLLERHMI